MSSPHNRGNWFRLVLAMLIISVIPGLVVGLTAGLMWASLPIGLIVGCFVLFYCTGALLIKWDHK